MGLVAFAATAMARVFVFFSPTGVAVMAVIVWPIFEAVDNRH